MSNFFNPDAPFMQGLGKVADLILLNILTVILSIPIVTAGAAVTALYDAMWRILRDEGSIYKNFFLAFKNNFKQATVIWLLALVTGVLMVFSILFYVSNEMMVPLVLSAVFFLLWAVTVAWVFPLQSRFENPVMVTIKNAVLCGLGQFPRSLVMAVLNLLPWVVFLFLTSVFFQMGFIWISVWFGLAAYLNMMVIRKPFFKMAGVDAEPEEEPGGEDEE